MLFVLALKWLKEIYHVEIVDIHIPEKFVSDLVVSPYQIVLMSSI